MATVIRTNLGTILLRLQARLVSSLAWDASTVLICDPDKTELNPHENFLFLWPGGGSFSKPLYTGAGRVDTRETVNLEVTLKTRNALDETTSSASLLTDPSLGHLAYRGLILDALLEPWAPTDDGTVSGNWLVTAPLVPLNWGRARVDPNEKYRAASKLNFSFEYELDLTQPNR